MSLFASWHIPYIALRSDWWRKTCKSCTRSEELNTEVRLVIMTCVLDYMYIYIYTLHNLKCVSESLYNGRRLPPSWLSVRLACPIIQLNLTLSNLIRVFSSPSKGIKKKQRAWKIKDHCKVQPVVYILCQNHKHEEFKSQSSPVSLNPLPHTMGTHSSILGWLA